MHILGLLVAVIAGAGVWYWRYKMLRDVGGEVLDAVGRAQGAFRTRNFRNKAEASVLNAVDDPALAATLFLFSLSNENSAGEHLAEPEIRRQVEAIVPAGKLDEFIAYASWAARGVVDSRDCVRRFKPLWRQHLDAAERDQLIDMAEAVVALTAKPEHSQAMALDALRTALTP
ncbi:hypothetical protein [Devosia sp.]|uniref:hypothetical protein n=1 Tax=Devosia sp. TaxID=1871048 RepID=UPI00262ACA3A|nr:hypothetical protein [Devosia sp.]